MFKELAMTITIIMLASFFTAVTFTPMLCSKWLKINPQIENKPRKVWFKKFYDFSERLFKGLEEFYAKALGWCLSHKKLVIFGFLTAFIASLFLVRFVGNEFIPEEDTGDLRPTVNLPIGTRVEETDKVASCIEGIFKADVPETQFMYIASGQSQGIGSVMGQQSGSHIISSGAKLVSKTERKRSVREVARIVREKIKEIPGVLKTDITTGNPLGRIMSGTTGKQIQVEILGHSFEETDVLAQKIKSIMEKIPGAVDVSISRELNRPELRVQVDRVKASALGLDMRTIADSIKTYVEGATATKYREKGDTYDIYVRLEEKFRAKPEDVENLSIVSPFTGKQIKLSTVARVYETAGPIEIERKNRERILRVECNTYRRSMGKVVEDIQKEIQKITIPSGITISFGGEAEEQKKAFADLTLLLVLGICLVYMVMAAQFESLIDPFIIMFSVPFTFTGVILGFVLTGVTLNIISFLAIAILMGYVVNNAIVLISYIIILRQRGYNMLEAVKESGRNRLRPILISTITTLAGLFPLALSKGEGAEIWQPIGVTMLGGLTVSTLITLLFVPTLYAAFEAKFKNNKKAAAV
jgi:HAE1 family hydrophobic/amphiphilic exporter-1